MAKRSSLELMLEEIQKREEQPKKEPPALPTRPVLKNRRPRARMQLPLEFHVLDCDGSDRRMHVSLLSKGIMSKSSLTKGCHDDDEYDADDDDGGLLDQEEKREIFFEKVDCKNSFIMSTDDKHEAFRVDRSDLVDLRMRVLKTEARLEKKIEENAFLQKQIRQIERTRQLYESKMKSMEKTWQDRLRSMQISLATKRSASDKTRGKLGVLFGLQENCDRIGDDDIIGIKSMKELIEKEHQIASTMTLEVELQKLKKSFKAWKKDFKDKLTKLDSFDICYSQEKIAEKSQMKGIQSRILCF